MAISDKTRKTLWARSGNRCAICRHELVAEVTHLDAESVVGEECHIVSPRPMGPRFDSSQNKNALDRPSNLILLCRIHHKMADDQPETYTVEKLHKVKTDHEQWVHTALAEHESSQPRVRIRRLKGSTPAFLGRLLTGRDLFAVIDGAYAYQFDHDELESEFELDLISAFLQELQDYGDLSADFEASDRVKTRFELSARLKELEEAGFLVFGDREVQSLEGGLDSPSPWPVAIINVLRQNNPQIVKVGAAQKSTESS